MKKSIFIISSFLLILGTVSCNGSNPSLDDSFNSSLSSSFSSSSTTSSIDDGSKSSWSDLEANLTEALTYESIIYTIPSFEADKYYVANTDNYGTNMCIINCFGGFEGNVSEISYSRKLRENGFEITDQKEEENCIYGVKEVLEDEVAVVIQFSYIEEIKQFQKYCYFAIMTYLYVNVKNPVYTSWPSNEISQFLMNDIPAYNDASSYELLFSTAVDNISCIDIYCYDAKDDAETSYYSTLEDAGYQITNSNSIYFATNEQNKIEMMFYMSFDNIFFIRAYNI